MNKSSVYRISHDVKNELVREARSLESAEFKIYLP